MRVSYQEACLSSLRYRLVQTGKVSSDQLPDSALESILKNPTGKAVRRELGGLSGQDPSIFAGIATKFLHEAHVSLAGDPDPAPPALVVNLCPDALERLKPFLREYKSAARSLAFNWNGNEDFSRLVDLAREINPDFNSWLDIEEVRTLDRAKWNIFSGDVLRQVLLPVNLGLFLNLQPNDVSLTCEYEIQRPSWNQDSAYADHVIWTADARLKNPNLQINSQTFENYVLIDRDQAIREGVLFYEYRLPITPQFQMIHAVRLSPEQYAVLLSYNRVLCKQVAAARNQILVKEWVDQNEAELFGLSHGQKHLRALLVDDSIVHRMLNPIPDDDMKALVLDQFSNNLCGLIGEMEFVIKEGRSDIATLSFLDFYGTAVTLEDCPGGSLAYKMSALSQKLILDLINARPEMSAVMKDINSKNLHVHAEILLEALKDIRRENLRDLSSILS